MQQHSKLLQNIQEKIGESVSWSYPCHVPTLMSKVSCNQRVFIAINPGRIPLHMQSTCGKYVYVLVCATYVPSISQMHTVVLPGKMQVHQCIQEGYIQEVQERGGGSIFFFVLSFATFPLREAIYVYTRYVCLSSFLFPGDLHDSLDILWQPLRKSDNLCGSLAIPSQVYEQKGSNMMQQKHCSPRNVEKWGPDRVLFCIYIYYISKYICIFSNTVTYPAVYDRGAGMRWE